MTSEASPSVDDSALLPRRDCLTQCVIYDHPRDHPDYFVVRPWDIVDGNAVPRSTAGLFRELDKARQWCAQYGLVRMDRMGGDDPLIIEVWI